MNKLATVKFEKYYLIVQPSYSSSQIFHSQIFFILKFSFSDFHSQIFSFSDFHSQIFEITPNTKNENLRIKKSETNYSLVIV